MLEVEVKLQLLSPGALRERLRDLGATPRGVFEQVDTYLRHPGRDLAATDEALRVRREGERFQLTYKGPRHDAEAKVREERTVTTLDDPTPLLDGLGFTAAATVRKRRERYDLGPVEVAIDEVAGLGTFCEVEALPDAMDPAAVVEDAIKRLGLAGADRFRESYLELAFAAGVAQEL